MLVSLAGRVLIDYLIPYNAVWPALQLVMVRRGQRHPAM
jgi:hypothetical protein